MLSAAALEHVQNLRHRGPLDHAQYVVAGVPGDGPTLSCGYALMVPKSPPLPSTPTVAHLPLHVAASFAVCWKRCPVSNR